MLNYPDFIRIRFGLNQDELIFCKNQEKVIIKSGKKWIKSILS